MVPKKALKTKKSPVKPAVKKRLGKGRISLVANEQHGPDYDFILWVSLPSRAVTVLGGNWTRTYQTIYKRDKVHQDALAQAVQKGIYHYEWNSNLSNGKSAWFQTTCIAQAWPDGRVKGVLCLSRNITRLGQAALAQGKLSEWNSPKTFSQILLAARENERREISKALHDEVGSSSVILRALLSLIKMDVQKGNTKRALRDIEQLDQQLKQVLERLRGIIVSLRPPTLDNAGGLCGAIRDLLTQISTLSHLPYQFQCNVKDEQIMLTENVRILLFRIVQEALTNIVKHAHASHIGVCLKRVGSAVALQVWDDGIGFNPKNSISIDHVGLLAMKDSVEMLGGKLIIKSTLGKGTRIEVRCPSVVYGGKQNEENCTGR